MILTLNKTKPETALSNVRDLDINETLLPSACRTMSWEAWSLCLNYFWIWSPLFLSLSSFVFGYLSDLSNLDFEQSYWILGLETTKTRITGNSQINKENNISGPYLTLSTDVSLTSVRKLWALAQLWGDDL